MTPEERALIDGLFDRMRAVENQPRDAEAEALIARRTSEAPHATYTLAQTVLVQEHALQQAAARIQELEAQAQAAQAQQPAPSFLGGLFGGGAPRGTSVPTSGARTAPMGLPQGYNAQQPGYGPQAGAQPSGPWGQQPQYQQPQYQQPQRPGMFGGGGGGGFLQGALATAAGVAGGALLFQGIQGLMSHGSGPIAQQASSLLEQPAAAAGDLASQAQEALGGAPDTNVAAADTGSDPWSSGSSDTGYQDAGYDDGGDFGGDDSNWA